MTAPHTEQVSAAFDRKANVYDAFGEDHVNLTRMRTKVYDHIARHVAKGSHLLEMNAGTGLDAVAMVNRGYTVHATDLAPAMVSEIQTKIEAQQLTEQLSAQQLDFTQLAAAQHAPFDAIYSNSGGLNCIADLGPVVAQLPSLLKPQGTVTWVIMPRFCPWELLLTVKDRSVGLRRWQKNGVMANVEGVNFRTWYHDATAVQRLFNARFEFVECEALSLVTPTADNNAFARRRPRLYNALVTLDDALSTRAPFKRWGDFYILTMRFIG